MENQLENIGLTKWESQTYLALLELGSTTTGPLVQKSQVPQSKIYGVLDSLMQKGLASYIIKGKTKYFQASDSKKIRLLFKEKEKQIESLLSELKSKQIQQKQSVELYEGMKAIRSLFLDILNNAKKGEDWYGFGTGIYADEEIKEFYNWLGPLKHNTKIKDHLLSSLKNKNKIEKGVEKESLKEFRKMTKYVEIAFPGDVAIFKNHVIILNWEETPTAIHIVSKILTEQYREFFLTLWKIAKK